MLKFACPLEAVKASRGLFFGGQAPEIQAAIGAVFEGAFVQGSRAFLAAFASHLLRLPANDFRLFLGLMVHELGRGRREDHDHGVICSRWALSGRGGKRCKTIESSEVLKG